MILSFTKTNKEILMRKIFMTAIIGLVFTAMACSTVQSTLCSLGVTSYCTASPTASPSAVASPSA